MTDIQPHCPVCGSHEIIALVNLGEIPVHCNVLWRTAADAIEAPRGVLRLGHCTCCTHSFNYAFDPSLANYSPDYENSLDCSVRFHSYITELASQLVVRYGLYGKHIIEIGCGDGSFLRLLCKQAKATGVGFDPSHRETSDSGAGGEGITYIREYYDERYAACVADFICCRHVLEHISDPHTFLTGLRRAIGDRMGTAVFFEVPNALYTFRDLSIWDLIYEHCSYFTAQSLAQVFFSCGFAVARINTSFDEEFLCIEAAPHRGNGRGPKVGLSRIPCDIAQFQKHYREKVAVWQERLDGARRAGKRVVVWGAGSKGTMFLNTLGREQAIEYAIDINPRKEGMYVAGTGHRIVSPDLLRSHRPDLVIIMNRIYKNEIRKCLTSLGLTTEIACA